MQIGVVVYGALFAAAVVLAQVAHSAPPPAPAPWKKRQIKHDQVQPFPQPEPKTVSEKAAVKFKPQLHISDGCHSYPAVNAAGETSGGLEPSGDDDGKCKGSGYGSQVYGRSAWHQDIWAMKFV